MIEILLTGVTTMFESRRLFLRHWTMSDRSSLNAILGDPEVMRFSDRGALSDQDQDVWLQNTSTESKSYGLPGLLAIERKHDSQIIGYVSLVRDLDRISARDAEIGFRLARCAWGQGYATEASGRLINVVREAGLADRLVAIVDPNNQRSVRVLEKLGMTFERDIMFQGYDYPDHFYVRQVQPHSNWVLTE